MDVRSVASMESRRSVGNGLAMARMVAPGAPAYDNATQQLVEEIRRGIARDAEKKRASVPVLMPFALEPRVMAEFVKFYPEYRIIPLNTQVGVHSVWQAHRFMALNACIDAVHQFTKSVVMVGDGLYQVATRGLRGVHLETDPSDAVGVHSRHTSAIEYLKAANSRVEIDGLFGYNISAVDCKDFLEGKAFQVCSRGGSCSHRAEGMVIDLSMHPMSVKQACGAMQQCGAKFAEVFLPYTPDLFRVDEGEWPDSDGVGFLAKKGVLQMIYPDGNAGATDLSMAVWAEWLREDTVTVGFGQHAVDFRLELMQTRGPFLYCRIVKLEGRQAFGLTRHALDMPWAKDKYVLSFARLRSVKSNPAEAAAWQKVTRIVSKRVVDKLLLYAMALPQQEFTPENVYRRLTKMDSRVIVSGMNVRLVKALPPEEAMDVAIAVFCKAFVSRYEMNKLGVDLLGALSAATRFASATRAQKLRMVFSGMLTSMITPGVWTHGFRDALVSYITGRQSTVVPSFVAAPEFVLMDNFSNAFVAAAGDLLRRVSGGYVSLYGLRGGATALKGAPIGTTRGNVDYVVSGADIDVTTRPTGDLHDDIVDMSVAREVTSDITAMVEALAVENDLGTSRRELSELQVTVRKPEVPQGHEGREVYEVIPDPVGVLNQIAEQVFPGMYRQDYELDADSMRVDPQERDLQVEYLELPVGDPVRARSMAVYKSRLKSYNVERKVQNLQETLTALSARNMAAPAMRIESDEHTKVLDCWDRLKLVCFSDDCEEKLASFASDKVGFEAQLLEEWGKQARAENVRKVWASAIKGIALEDMKPWEYDIMLKSDAKPPLSDKPTREVIAPQLIVMQDKYVNAMYSSIFRIMSRRLVSLLKPGIMVNLLKDTEGIRDHIAANHPWGEQLTFLENDFSKFDKSQDRFSYMVMMFVMEKLGFDQALLDRWLDFNERVVLRSAALGLLMVSRYQNKSGASATSLMNAVMNMTAVSVCYAGTEVVWGTFMGDDSLIACRRVCASQRTMQMMAEMFNFEAKFFVLKRPYFTSCFVLFDDDRKKVFLVPDFVKRIQKYSVSVSANEPSWEDKARSAYETLLPYRHSNDLVDLADAVAERYGVGLNVDLKVGFDALATLSASESAFRGIWESDVTIISA